MATTDRKRRTGAVTLLLGFHAVMSGAFLTAYLSGGEDSYGIHVFAGYTVIAALAARLLMAAFAPRGSMLRLPRPSLQAAARWLGRVLRLERRAMGERSPLLPWIAVLILAGTAAAALSGAVADYVVQLEHLHEALGDIALFLAIGHGVAMFLLAGLKRLSIKRLPAAVITKPREVLP
ncbi:hypothetical protein [Zavarzinia sp.]|uniref:hypothetical protein n=1 Tax=Zavarzinia sp. TaxID=2027920 RepID=UPI0035680FA5